MVQVIFNDTEKKEFVEKFKISLIEEDNTIKNMNEDSSVQDDLDEIFKSDLENKKEY